MNLVYKKILGQFTKVLGIGKTPLPPMWEKFPNNPVFFLLPPLAGPDGYPRVLDYSTFEFTTLPYSKNFTTRSSSRVVTISFFLSNLSNIQKIEMWNFCDWLVILSPTKCCNYNDVLPVLYCQFTVFLTTGGMLLIEQSDSDWMTQPDIQDNKQLLSLLLDQLINLFISYVLLFQDLFSFNRGSLRSDAPLILVQSLFHSVHQDFENLCWYM